MQINLIDTRPRGYKKIMLNSAEQEINLLVNVKMPMQQLLAF